MKIFGDKAQYFLKTNDVLNNWDWRHDNLNRYSNFFLKCKGLFKVYSIPIFLEYEKKEEEFKHKWVSFHVSEDLLIKRAHGYDKMFFFRVKIPDKNNSWGYRYKRVKFDYTELKADLDNLVLWVDQKRAELYRIVSINFSESQPIDFKPINQKIEDKPLDLQAT